MVAVYAARNKLHTLKPNRPGLQYLRGTIGFISPLAFFVGIKHIPLTDAVVLFFSSIFIVTLLSMIFLKEKVGPHRWVTIFIGFIGVLIVATPQGGGQLSGYLLVLLGSATYSLIFVSGKYLSRTESVASLVFSYNLCVGVVALILLPWFWLPLDMIQVAWLVVLSLLAVGGHYFITMAFASDDASLVAPFEYTALIWAIMFDLVVWSTTPSATTIGGATIIVGSGLYIVHRERLQKGPG